MKVRFWGTRGSLATPGPTTARYGGNTSCVEVRTAAGTLLLLDCGTGARLLGQELLASGQPLRGHVLLTHMHWDHIQGLPFFAPLFIPGNEWDIYAPHGLGQMIEHTLAGQMQYSYFPVTLGQLGATIRYHDLTEGELDAGEVRVTARYLNHPGLTLGYRLECGGVAVVYSTDHEPHSRRQAEGAVEDRAAAPRQPVHAEDRQHLEFVAGADLLIHDAQYSAAEYPSRVGWGHSTHEYVVELAMATGVRQLALFHHDPSRGDEALDAVLAAARQRVAAAGSPLAVTAAAEGQSIELAERPGAAAPAIAAGREALVLAPREQKGPTPVDAAPDESIVAWLQARGSRYRTKLLVVAPDPLLVESIRDALRPDGFLVMASASGPAAMEVIREHKPVLVLIDEDLDGLTAAELCQAIRLERDGVLRDIPVVLLSAAAASDDAGIEAGFQAGFTDCLAKPFSPQYVRSRVRAWLMRSGVGGRHAAGTSQPPR